MLTEKSPRIERLKARTKHCCCKYCGGELRVRQIIFQTQADARIELYCDQCQKIEYGVEKEIYASARAFVQATQFDYFEDVDDCEQRLQMNIAKVCTLTSWQLKFLGLLQDDGFTVLVHANEYESDQCMTINDSDLQRLLEEAVQWRERSLMPED